MTVYGATLTRTRKTTGMGIEDKWNGEDNTRVKYNGAE